MSHPAEEQRKIITDLIEDLRSDAQRDIDTALMLEEDILPNISGDDSTVPEPPPPPPLPETVLYQITAVPHLNVRVEPSRSAQDIGDVFNGTLQEIVETKAVNDDIWGHIKNWGWIAIKYGTFTFAKKV